MIKENPNHEEVEQPYDQFRPKKFFMSRIWETTQFYRQAIRSGRQISNIDILILSFLKKKIMYWW